MFNKHNTLKMGISLPEEGPLGWYKYLTESRYKYKISQLPYERWIKKKNPQSGFQVAYKRVDQQSTNYSFLEFPPNVWSTLYLLVMTEHDCY